MRRTAEEIKESIREDVRKFPKEPHMWRRETREVAFGGDDMMERLMPIDVDSIRKSFKKVEAAEKKALQNYNKVKKRAASVVVKADREYLEGLSLSLENSILTNDKFKIYTASASGLDVQAERDKRRRQKGQIARVGKLFPIEGDVVDAEKGTVEEVNYTSWIHWKEAPDEFKTVKTLSALGKFKGKLKNHRDSKMEHSKGFGGLMGGGKGKPAKADTTKQVKSNNPNPFMSIDMSNAEFEAKEMKQKLAPESKPLTPKPTKEEEIDWEAKAQEFLAAAQIEETELQKREMLSHKIGKKAPGHKVIMAVKYQPDDASQTSSILSTEAKNRVLRQRAVKRTPSAPSIFAHLKEPSNVTGEDSLLSDFDYYNSVHTPIIDIGAATSIDDLASWGGDMGYKVAEISMLKARKHEELKELIEAEEGVDEGRKEEERRTKHPARRRRVKIRHEKERKERREVIMRVRQENELIIANKMAEFGLIR
ncbi:hypothetical protein TrLO_g15075 [Triparma laevis f. longispina]|uniref:Uncharacterized protein n=1 Tax=Triparma laevis f. longispina TaxID=1714387 RepID=A0A9W7A9Q9_9STRA|nr:hypothetical protein TrLO_g15075 [Triparma laevis f. longispina]